MLSLHRYLHIRILLFRPLLLNVFAHSQQRGGNNYEDRDHMNSLLHRTLLMQASNMCISAARELADMIASNIESESESLPE
jgi:hypothetical protein